MIGKKGSKAGSADRDVVQPVKKLTAEDKAVMPNSLNANIGKRGFDCDGIKQIIQQDDKS